MVISVGVENERVGFNQICDNFFLQLDLLRALNKITPH